MPQAMAGATLTHILSFGKLPELDALNRPRASSATIHDRCYRRPFYKEGQFAKSFLTTRGAPGLVPVRTRLRGTGDPQRMRVAEVERRRVVPDPVGARLHRLLSPGSGTAAASTSRRRRRPATGGTIQIAAAGGLALAAGSALLARQRIAAGAKED